jgi:hypothetical protein
MVYDELVERGEAERYAGLIGWAQSTALVANLTASGAAAWLYHLGGYALVGWTSVALAGVQGVLAATLPVSYRARHAPHRVDIVSGTERAASGYVTMLRAGLAEARHRPDVRRLLVLAATMVGLTTYDEYFPLVARDHDASTTVVPVLVAVTVVGQAVGTALVGRSARAGGGTVAVTLGAGALLISAGALVSPYAGFLAIAAGYGLVNNAMLVGETRLQDAIVGPARATVTSVLGLLEEVVAVAVFVGFTLGSRVLGFPELVALLALPAVLVALAVARWLPDRRQSGAEDSAHDSAVRASGS